MGQCLIKKEQDNMAQREVRDESRAWHEDGTVLTLTGNITGEPMLSYTPKGVAVAKASMAVNEREFNEVTGKWDIEKPTEFYRLSVWREAGENAAECLPKGTRVIVVGRYSFRSYEKKDGTVGYSHDIDVNEMGPSIRWTPVEVQSAQREKPAPAPADDEDPAF